MYISAHHVHDHNMLEFKHGSLKIISVYINFSMEKWSETEPSIWQLTRKLDYVKRDAVHL